MNRGHGRGPLRKGPKLEKGATKYVLKYIWKYIKKYPVHLVIVTIAIILGSAFSLSLPILVQVFIDNHVDAEVIDMTGLLLIVGGIIAGTILVSITTYFQSYLMAVAASRATKEIRHDAFNKLTDLPIKYYDTNLHGDIMSKLTNDVDAISQAISQVIPQLITTIITFVGAIVLMFVTSWQLALVAVIAIPLAIITTGIILKKGNKYYSVQQQAVGEMNGLVEENINGLKVVKLYNQEAAMNDRFAVMNEKIRKASYSGQIYTGMMMPVIRLIDNIIYGLLVGVGAILNINYGLSVGKIASMTQFARMSTRPINNLAQVFGALQIAIAGGYRVFKLMDEQDEYVGTSNELIKDTKGHIEFENVRFSYEENEEVLKGISFEANSGETIAIVGPTGSGKTTIINLLTRFYDPNSGRILLDGVDINEYAKRSLRTQVGIVLQSTYLFKGTVLDNIRYGRPTATEAEVVDAAKLAQVHDIIERLPNKYHTRVREGGLNFSHGERQLISIARTILFNPSILILDEATSSVDTRTESRIQKSMEMVTEGRTSFIIAHRLQTIRNADKVLVIKNGEIIEQGNHDELIKKNGLYAEMHRAQFDI